MYGCFIGDSLSLLLGPVEWVPSIFKLRNMSILVAAATILTPLCLQKELKGLGISSSVGLASVIFTLAFIALRSLDGTYKKGGPFYGVMTSSPKFVHPMTITRSSAVVEAILSRAFRAHPNAPNFYVEL